VVTGVRDLCFESDTFPLTTDPLPAYVERRALVAVNRQPSEGVKFYPG
jgi:hypothetical protein